MIGLIRVYADECEAIRFADGDGGDELLNGAGGKVLGQTQFGRVKPGVDEAWRLRGRCQGRCQIGSG